MLPLLLLLLFSSCAQTFYHKQKFVQPQGLDFSRGNWFLGVIEINKGMSDELADAVLKDFSGIAKGTVKYAATEKSVLVVNDVPLHPGKEVMLDLKRTTGSDFYINLKCASKRKDKVNFESDYQMYFDEKMTYGVVILEVYDLNRQEVLYSQAVTGKCHEETGINNDFERKVILGCYKAIFKEIKKKYT